jgi:uncharacterized repeat protein (TIGR01451 family)
MASSTREFLRRMRVGFPPARRRLASPFHPSHVALVGVTTAVLAALLWLGADGVSTQAGAPGGVSGAAFWVKADSGLQVNGSSHVEQWLDQSGTANITTELRAAHPAHTNAILPSADILRIANGINFNPAVDFTGAVGKSLKGNAATEWDLTPLSIFAVAFREGALPADMAGVFTASVRWTGATTGSAGIGIAPTSAGYFLDGNGCFAGGTTSSIAEPRVIRGTYASGATGAGGSTWLNGAQEGSGTGCATAATTLFEIGGRTAADGFVDSRIFNGKIPEVVVYKSNLPVADANRIESYLALKYGITLRQTPAAKNYIDSGTAVIWDATVNAAYNNNIAGIGRDGASLLDQKQSRSVNVAASGNLVTIGLGLIAVDNVSNTSSFAADRDFLTWGDNGLATPFSVLLNSPSGIGSQMLRTWRTQETGTIGTVMVGVPSTLGVGTPLYLVVSNDATFDASDTWLLTAPFSPDGLTTYLAANADFASGQYFTFATVPPLDLADAAASYGTLLANDGARHGVPGYNPGGHTAPLMLGTLIDVEADGQPSTAADADDTIEVDDEDGVVMPMLVAGQPASVGVTVTNSGAPARLSAWADWNANGSFADVGEQIVTNLAVVAGPTAVSIAVPASVIGAITFRFRLSTQTNLGPIGVAADGEVEDYQAIVVAAADLAITKTDGQASYVPGALIAYTLVVTNAGPSNAAGVNATDAVPTAISGVFATCAANGAASCGTNASSGNSVSFAGATVPFGAGNQLTITINGIVDQTTTGNVVNTATVALGVGADSNAANNTATDTDTQGASQVDLSIAKTDGQAAYVPGTVVTYTVTVQNAGPSTANGVAIADVVPASITGVTTNCIATGTASCGVNGSAGNNVLFTGASLRGGAGNVLTITVGGTIDPAATGTLANTATVAPGVGSTDTSPANNSATDSDAQATGRADLSIAKTGPTSVRLGETVTYTITVSNAGPSNATSVMVTDPTPAGLTFVSTSGACTTPFPCALGTIAPGETRQIGATYQVPLAYSASGPIANTASVASAETDSVPANNSSTASTIVPITGCDVNGDGVADFVTGAGPGGGPHVRVWTTTSGVISELHGFFAYDPYFAGGARVACRDMTGDGVAEIITGAGPGGGPHVRVWSFTGGGVVEIAGWFAYDPYFPGGVFVAAGDVTGDGVAEVITGAGAGGGPHVRVWRLAGGGLAEVAGFFAYDPNFAGGVSVATGDVDGDGIAEIITGAGPNGGPHVRIWSFSPGGGVTERAGSGFFPYDPRFPGGVSVATGDVDGDGVTEIITGAGPGGGPHVRFWRLAGESVTEVAPFGYFAYSPYFPGGVVVAAGDLDGDDVAELITGAGPGGGPHVRVWKLIGGVPTEVTGFFAYDPAFPGGAFVAR